MTADRLQRLQQELAGRQVDALALIPGANMRYMTGYEFHLMERPIVLFVPAKGKPVFVVPSLEALKFEGERPFDFEVFAYTDEDGPEEAFKQAALALPEVAKLTVEYLQMRVLELKLIQRRMPNAIIEDANPIMDVLRVRKSAEEIALMREAVEIAERALSHVMEGVRPGMTERDVMASLSLALMEAGSGPLPFEGIVLAGERAALPHGGPTDREINVGDVLLLDFGARKEGYISDITRTFAVGRPLEGKHKAVYEAVKAANAAGRAAARPGVTCEEVDRAARKVIEDAGFGKYFVHRTGHGIGLDGHERPYIVEGNKTVLEVGMAFTVEPGIYIPGEIGVRIEDDMIVTADGADSLTTFGRDLIVVGED